ncbi:MAG: molybdopterin-dependent oxidoreductase [Myxococcota bacterium]
MSTRETRTYCRICEAHCGLVAKVDTASERVVAIRPDRDHPVSQGYSCVKGLALGELHHDEDRLDYPMKRTPTGYQRIGWAQAIGEIGEKVRAIREAHGDRSVALYTGNPTYFSFQNIMLSSGFLEALHSPNLFASHSVDNNNKLHVSTEMFGRSMVHAVPDFDGLHFFMCLGSNPMVSQMSIIQLPNAVAQLRGVTARGGRVVIVDPRRTETAHKVGEHVPIMPGTDAYLLMALLHVLTHEDSLDLRDARALASGIDEFVGMAAPWTPERVAVITGIEAERIRELARAYRDAPTAALYMSTGVNQGPFGSIAYWLVQGLNLITGNLDRKGGLLFPRGAFDTLKLAQWIGLGTFDEHRTLRGDWHRVAGCFPVAALPDEIDNDHPERIRALFVSAGNPVHAMPGGQRLAAALKKLDLLVSIDLYRNETAAEADYLLPATDMLERSDYPASHALLQVRPHAQWTPKVVEPKFERREEWRIFSDLAVACGAKPWGGVGNLLPHINRVLAALPGRAELTPDHLLALLLRWGGDVSLSQLKREPGGVLLPPLQPGSFLGRRVPTPDGRVRLYPPRLAADLPRLDEQAEHLAPRPGRLVLIGRRQRHSHNSWMHNNPRIRLPPGNTALLHPEDASAHHIEDGDEIEIETGQGVIRLQAQLTEDMRPGVVAVPHGWGHRGTSMTRAEALPGANVNEVIPGGHLEPVSGMAVMLGHAVQVRRAAVQDDATAPAG